MVSIVVAQGANRVIGARGGLPWRLPSDMRRFRELTVGHPVVMGRKTFESIPARFRPLPDRRNLVVSRSLTPAPGVEVHGSLEDALAACGHDCFVIGGGQIYEQALALADRIYLTHVDLEPEGDAFFPALDGEWACVAEGRPIRENDCTFVFKVYDRAG